MFKVILYNVAKVISPAISNSFYANLLFLVNCLRFERSYYWLSIKHPKTFNEKINYIKFNSKNPLAPIVADKFAVREYVKNKIGKEYLIPLIVTFDSPEEIDITGIKEDCILKMNNGSGGNFIVRQSDQVTNEELIAFFGKEFKKDMYVYNREWHYKKITPKIVVEKLIGNNPNDYKFFCSGNKPFAIQLDVDRYINHKRNIYDMQWNLLPQKIRLDNYEGGVPQPNNFDKMKSWIYWTKLTPLRE